MKTWIALLRGINVGGHHLLPMKRLAAIVEALGGEGVRTYIQSGNVVFRCKIVSSAKLERAITDAIEAEFGFAPRVMLIAADAFAAAVAGNPFPHAEADHKSLHLWFLDSPAAGADVVAMEAIKNPNERFALVERVFYLHAPDGIGKSKLAERVERLLGVAATARNWRTVTTLVEMAGE